MYVDKSLTLPEIFERVASKDTVDEKADLLARYDNTVVRWFVESLYSGKYNPLFVPKYKKSDMPPRLAFMNLSHAITRLNGCLRNIDKPRIVERNLLLVLESMTNDEAELVEKLIKNEKRITGVSKSVFKRVYPQFFRDEKDT